MDDARRLVEPPKEEEEEEESSFPPVVPPATQNDEQIGKENGSSDNLLNAIVGRKQSRDRSVDSAQSSGSGKRVAFAVKANSSFNKAGSPTSVSTVANEPLQTGNSAVGSMRSLGSTLNPLKGFGGMTVMRGFGRNTSSSIVTPTLTTAGQAPLQKDMTDTRISTIKILPPVQRYMDAASAEDLKLGEVAGLLKDYKRLACALKDIGAF